MNGDIDRIPVSQLMERYGLVKSAVYTRLDALGIERERVGNKAYVNAQQLALLDELHAFIKAKGTIPEFLDMKGMSSSQNESRSSSTSGQSSGMTLGQPDIMQLMATFAAQLASKMQPAAKTEYLAHLKALEEASRNGWQLSSLEIAELLDLDIDEMKHYGDRFMEAGFVFTKVGFRSGGQIAWRVSKQ
jgi:hypothetical protein